MKYALVEHFQTLINAAIQVVEVTTCDEMNSAHATVLYKGHKKDKTSAGSYRTISSCPFISKCLDTNIREHSISEWTEAKAETQFIGSGMSHELGALLPNVTINHSLTNLNKPKT